MGVVVAGPVDQDGGIEHFTAAGAFPGYKGADEIIERLGKHTTLTTWTVHNQILPL